MPAVESWPPPHSRPLVEFQVAGDPKPAGSKNAIPLGKRNEAGVFVPFRGKDGRPVINMRDSSGVAGENWRADIRAAAALVLEAGHALADGPLVVEAIFYSERPKSHFGSGRNAGVLKASAPAYPHATRLADGTKLMRALEDALNSLVWSDDRRIVDARWSRRFGKPGARVKIWALLAPNETVAPASGELALFEGDRSGIIPEDAEDADRQADREDARERVADWGNGGIGDPRDQGAKLPA